MISVKKTLTMILAAGFLVSPAQAEGPLSKEQIEEIVGEYIHNNPEVILQSIDNYRKTEQAKAEQKAEDKLKQHLDYLTEADAPSIGDPEADVTIVEFFDYNCGYCKRALPDIQALVEENENIRVVFREMPILSQASMEATKWALAAHGQGKYFDYHMALMKHNGQKNEAALEKIAKKLDLDVEKMKKDAASEKIEKTVNKDLMVATDIGVRGTPAFVVGGKLYRGYLGKDGLKAAVENAYKDNKDDG